MSTRVTMKIDPNEGYSPDQINNAMTLADLRNLVSQAIAEHGPDALVVLDNGQRYGARYGRVDPYADIEAEGDEDDDETEEQS